MSKRCRAPRVLVETLKMRIVLTVSTALFCVVTNKCTIISQIVILLLLFCTVTNKCTIISQIIILLPLVCTMTNKCTIVSQIVKLLLLFCTVTNKCTIVHLLVTLQNNAVQNNKRCTVHVLKNSKYCSCVGNLISESPPQTEWHVRNMCRWFEVPDLRRGKV
jgi:hypothetical protein